MNIHEEWTMWLVSECLHPTLPYPFLTLPIPLPLPQNLTNQVARMKSNEFSKATQQKRKLPPQTRLQLGMRRGWET